MSNEEVHRANMVQSPDDVKRFDLGQTVEVITTVAQSVRPLIEPLIPVATAAVLYEASQNKDNNKK